MRRYTLSHVLILFVLGLLLAGCGTSSNLRSRSEGKYRYAISLVSPVSSESMLYRDERLIIQFRFDDPAIRFQVQNLSSGTMQIDWGAVELNVGGTVSAVRSLATLYDTTGILPIFRSISSYGVMRDVILPVENASIEGGRWVLRDLLPTTDRKDPKRAEMIRSRKGNTIGLVLPVKFGAETQIYRFEFRIDSVREMSWRDVRSPAWLPPAPLVAGTPSPGFDTITAVVVAGGFAGFLYYLSTMNKTPAH